MENNKKLQNKRQETKSFWEKVQNEMQEKFGKDIFDSWLRKLNFVEEFNNYILLSVPTRFIRDWITSRYLDQILQIVKSSKKEITRIEISIDEKIIRDQKSNNNEYYSGEQREKNNQNRI